MRVVEFLNTVHHRQEAFAVAKALYRDRLAPDFNPFSFIAPNELKLSEILASLLDPKGKHGQGSRFLRAFLDHVGAAWTQEECESVRIQIEAPTDLIDQANRRIDILVTGGTRVLAIENKPWAADQQDQLSDYLKYMDRLGAQEVCLVYLSGAGSVPDNSSISSDEMERRVTSGQLRLMSYGDLVPWLRTCRLLSGSDRVSGFLDDFSRYIQRTFLGVRDMSEREQLVSHIIKSPDMVGAAFEVISSAPALKKQLLQTLVSQVQAGLPGSWTLESNITATDWPGFCVLYSDTCKCKFRFEFRRPAYDLCYGVQKTDRNQKSPEDALIQAALTKALGAARSNHVWPWIRNVSPADRYLPVESNWDATPEPWRQIADGKVLHEQLIQLITAIHDALKGAGLLEIEPQQ